MLSDPATSLYRVFAKYSFFETFFYPLQILRLSSGVEPSRSSAWSWPPSPSHASHLRHRAPQIDQFVTCHTVRPLLNQPEMFANMRTRRRVDKKAQKDVSQKFKSIDELDSCNQSPPQPLQDICQIKKSIEKFDLTLLSISSQLFGLQKKTLTTSFQIGKHIRMNGI